MPAKAPAALRAACGPPGLLGADALRRADALRAARSEALELGARVNRAATVADPGRFVVWALAEPDVGRAGMELLGAAFLFLGTDAGRFERRSPLARRAVAAADRLLRERRGRGPGHGG
jgi:hypothetical protein